MVYFGTYCCLAIVCTKVTNVREDPLPTNQTLFIFSFLLTLLHTIKFQCTWNATNPIWEGTSSHDDLTYCKLSTLQDTEHVLWLTTGLTTYIGFQSNFSSINLAHYFDVLIESCKVGLRKPDVAIYKLACQQLNIQPHNVRECARNLINCAIADVMHSLLV